MRLQIPEDYFKTEEREGFSVSEKMKRSWATQMDLMVMIDDICTRHGLRWWADCGTLLGAVRHKGFIPWDDDMDFSMMREDYDRLIMILPYELPECCLVEDHAVRKGYMEPWMCVHNRRHMDTGDDAEEEKITKQFYGNPFIDGIDIFPLDYIPSNEDEREVCLNLYSAIFRAAKCGIMHDDYEGIDREELLVEIEELTKQKIPRGDECEIALFNLADNIARIYRREECQSVTSVGRMLFNTHEQIRPLSLYSETLRLPFEMVDVPVPSGYLKVLESIYGADWRTPIRGTSCHDYPFFKWQEETIKNYRVRKMLRKAEELEEAGQVDEEQEVLKTGLSEYPDCYELHYSFARAVLKDDHNKALYHLKKAYTLCDNEENRAMIGQEVKKFERLDL